jgi:hypothetical protein
MICDCCTGVAIETPQAVSNRAGLSTIGYRTGTYASFLASMLAQIGTATAHGLRTRSDDDFTIALLDATAIVADVLTFYDERIANESYLRTSVELLSVAELARLIGYSPRPGASASAYLAFRINDPPPSPVPVAIDTLSSELGSLIPAGSKVQSMPAPGQTPQTFETQADLDARWVANALTPLLARPYPANSTNIDVLYVRNGGGGRVLGDRVLLASGGTFTLRTILAIRIDPKTQIAALTLDGGSAPSLADAPVPAPTPAPAGTTMTDTLVGQIVDGYVWNRDDLETLIARRSWSMNDFEATVNAARWKSPAGPALTAYAVKSNAALFGNNAPFWGSLPYSMRVDYTDPNTGDTVTAPYSEQWDTFGGVAGHDTLTYGPSSFNLDESIDLDAVYPAAVPGATVVFFDTIDSLTITATIETSTAVSRALYAMSGRVTSITLSNVMYSVGGPFFPSANGTVLGFLHPRIAAVYISEAALDLAPIPVTANVGDTSILLGRCVLPIPAGRFVAIAGERADRTGRISTEVAQLASVTLEAGYTRLTFSEPLDGTYTIGSVTINANVVPSSNGETAREILGSGDAGTPFQRFTLKQLPLTWVSAANPSGVDAAIAIYVNNIRWKRVPYLYGHDATERVYALTRDLSGATNVLFGDGIAFGARLPSGNENVMAVYRRGIGSSGLVAPAALSLLTTRPPGVRDVTNPLASDGAADPETVGQARTNAPFAVKTLGRIVTLEDYGDFVRASAGVAKSRVDLGWSGGQRNVLITVAGPNGAPILATSTLALNLVRALDDASDGAYPFSVRAVRPRSFSVSAALAIDPTSLTQNVNTAVLNALWMAFGFTARELGQPVFLSEVIATIAAVDGVIATNVTAFDYTEAVWPGIQPHLDAQPAAISGGSSVGAELLTIDSIPAALTVLT